MSRRVAVGIAGLVVLGVGCDSRSDDAEKPPTPPASADVEEIAEACRDVYERLPQPTRDATTEAAFVEQCLAAVSGRPDPKLPPRT